MKKQPFPIPQASNKVMMLALFLQTQVPLFQAPALKPNEVFAYANRTEMSETSFAITSDHKLSLHQRLWGRTHASASARDLSRKLTDSEWKSLSGLLTAASWATLPATKKKNPMWPSSYDGPDYLMLGRIGKEVKVWGNNVFEGSITVPYMDWVRRIVSAGDHRATMGG